MPGGRRFTRRRFRLPSVAALAFVAALLAAATPGRGQVEISFPLEGHYRVGRFLPVRVVAPAAAGVTLSAGGAVPTELPPGGGNVDAVVPWLAAGELKNAAWSPAAGASQPIATPLTPLRDDERLVGFLGDGLRTSAAALIFPGKAVVPVRLDPSRPPLLPAAAYEALDGVLLDANAAARVNESQLAVLLAAGMTVAVRSDARPGGDWPWRREGAFWVVRHDPAGPRTLIEPDAYQPTYGWVRGWPAGVRRRVVLGAVLFGVVAVGLSLWRSRVAPAAVVVAALAAAGCLAAWWRAQSPVLAAGGGGVVWNGELAQRDEWDYRTTLRPAAVEVPWGGLSRPVFASRQQVQQSGVRLVCTPAGVPERFVAKLEADQAIAFLSRSVSPQKPAAPVTTPVASPGYVLANQLYPGRLTGEAPAADGRWPTVYLEQAAEGGKKVGGGDVGGRE